MNRRSFIGSILALGCAPAIVRADSLMRIVPRETVLLEGMTFHGPMGFNEGDVLTFSGVRDINELEFVVKLEIKSVRNGVVTLGEPLFSLR